MPLLRAAAAAADSAAVEHAPGAATAYYRVACAECEAIERARALGHAAAVATLWDSAHGHLLAAAKRGPGHGESFARLGLLYEARGEASDALLATRCLSRAVDLAPAALGGQAGVALCALLSAGPAGEGGGAGFLKCREVQAAAVTKDATCWWAWAGLALAELALATGAAVVPPLNEGASAARASEMLQKALRIAPGRAELWCALGEVYLEMGRIVASVKALSRAEALLMGGSRAPAAAAGAAAPGADASASALAVAVANGAECGSAHLLERLGAACAMAGEHEAATLRFRAALAVAGAGDEGGAETTKPHPAATFGLASTLLALARASASEMRFATAVRQLREASQLAQRCAAALPLEVAPLKLLGDIHVTAARASDAPFARAQGEGGGARALRRASRRASRRSAPLSPLRGARTPKRCASTRRAPRCGATSAASRSTSRSSRRAARARWTRRAPLPTSTERSRRRRRRCAPPPRSIRRDRCTGRFSRSASATRCESSMRLFARCSLSRLARAAARRRPRSPAAVKAEVSAPRWRQARPGAAAAATRRRRTRGPTSASSTCGVERSACRAARTLRRSVSARARRTFGRGTRC